MQRTLITPEQYLATRYEREPEYVHGEIEERPLPNKKHGFTQARLAALLGHAGYVCTETRVELSFDLFRLPDIALWSQEPEGELPSTPPTLAIEIGSPDDRMSLLMRKFQQYRDWGVPHIWFVDPQLEQFFVYDGGLREVPQLHLPEFNITITPAGLFA